MKQSQLLYSLLIGSTFCFGHAMAQEAVHGTITAGGGVGTATPWEGDIKLSIPTSAVRISPYLSLQGITHQSSKTEDDRLFRYSKSGNVYESNQELKSEGFDLKYGTTALFPLRSGSFNILFEGQHHQQETTGWWNESVTDSKHDMLSHVQSNVSMPHQDWDQYRAGAGFTRQGFHVEYTYQYRNAHNAFKQDILQGHAGNAFLANDRDGETSTHNHHAKMTQSFRPAKGQQLTVGVDWVRNSIGQEHLQNVSSEGGSHKYTPRFDHRYQTHSAFMEYRYAYASVKAMARLEYAYTHMRYEGEGNDFTSDANRIKRSWNLNDLIPQVHLEWGVRQGDTLTADYRMIIKRPDIDVLDPTHIHGAYTIDYGNADLEGIHINNVSLAYRIHRNRFDYTTTLGGIIVEDGFNAIWMEKDNVRISTWGNEGVRRAYSVTPRLRWQAAERTSLTAQATLLWDKRIARAISMQKEHWGITAQAAIVQTLAPGCILNVHGQYSEGNTIDLYSHESRSYGAGASLQKALPHNVSLAIGYDYQEHAKAILTQGAYTGYFFNRPGSHHNAWLKIGYKL